MNGGGETTRPTPKGAWADRPPGLPAAVPPPSIPLGFLFAAAIGMVGCGVALWATASIAVVAPTADPVVMAVHLGMLATISMGVMGALHQFVPVITQRPLRSVRLAWITLAAWLAGSWLMPAGIGLQAEPVVETGALFAVVGIVALVVNLGSALSVRGKGTSVVGIRLALLGLVVTAAFGSLYVADRRGGWFVLSGSVVLGHAVIALVAWLGLSYVSIAEKLWPMFFLAHLPGRRRSGQVAVWAVPIGAAMVSSALLLRSGLLGAAGGAVLGAGVVAHLVSLVLHLRHRRRKVGLHFVFVTTSAAWLVVAAALAVAGGADEVYHFANLAPLAAAAVAATAAWLLEALVGHAYKVVPFIAWSLLRARGIASNAEGKQLGFADLYNHRWAVTSYVVLTLGLVGIVGGLVISAGAVVAAGALGLAVTAAIGAANLAAVPSAMLWQRRLEVSSDNS